MNFFLVLLIISVFAIFFLLIKEIKRQQSTSKTSAPPQVDLVNLKLDKKLLNMVSGDRQVAARLVSNIQKKYPGKTNIWYLEKMISDWEKDRR